MVKINCLIILFYFFNKKNIEKGSNKGIWERVYLRWGLTNIYQGEVQLKEIGDHCLKE